MIELLVIGGLSLVALVCGLCFLILLPLLFVGLALKLLLALLLLPFRLLGLALGAAGTVLAVLFKGAFGIVAVVVGLGVLALGVVLFPLGLVLLMILAAVGLVKLLAGATLGATA